MTDFAPDPDDETCGEAWLEQVEMEEEIRADWERETAAEGEDQSLGQSSA